MSNWQSIKNMPENGRNVLAYYVNNSGNYRIVKAFYAALYAIESGYDDDLNDSEYDDKTDTYYFPEGWYEVIDNWPDYSCVRINEGDVTHWMPLPEPPAKEE